MKTFLKVFATISISIFAIVSFIRFEVSIGDWAETGRGAFLFVTLMFSFIATALIEDNKVNK